MDRRLFLSSLFRIGSMIDLQIRRKVLVTLHRPAFPELLEGFFLVQWVHLHRHSFPDPFIPLAQLLFPGFGIDHRDSLALLVQCVLLPALGTPLAFLVDLPIGNQDMGMGIVVVLVGMDRISAGIALSGNVLPDVLLQDFPLRVLVKLPGQCHHDFFGSPGIVGFLVILDGIEQSCRLSIRCRSVLRQDRFHRQHSFAASVLMQLPGAFFLHLLAGNIREGSTGT